MMFVRQMTQIETRSTLWCYIILFLSNALMYCLLAAVLIAFEVVPGVENEPCTTGGSSASLSDQQQVMHYI